MAPGLRRKLRISCPTMLIANTTVKSQRSTLITASLPPDTWLRRVTIVIDARVRLWAPSEN